MLSDPFDEMRMRKRRMPKLFDEFWFEHPSEGGDGKLVPDERSLEPYREPYCDVMEGNKEVVITLELPGVEKGDIKIATTDNSVEILAERRSAIEERREEGYLRREMSYSKFYRKIPITVPVDSGRAKSSYKNGILEIVLPKTSEAPKRR